MLPVGLEAVVRRGLVYNPYKGGRCAHAQPHSLCSAHTVKADRTSVPKICRKPVPINSSIDNSCELMTPPPCQ